MTRSPYIGRENEIEIIHGVVSKVGYVTDEDVYVYQLEGSREWYNENWLELDIFLPMTLEVDIVEEDSDEDYVNEQGKKEEIDALLDKINDYKRLEKEFGWTEYADKAEEIKRKIADIKNE